MGGGGGGVRWGGGGGEVGDCPLWPPPPTHPHSHPPTPNLETHFSIPIPNIPVQMPNVIDPKTCLLQYMYGNMVSVTNMTVENIF